MSKSKRRSFSLIELIIACSLVGCVFAVFASTMWYSIRYEALIEKKTAHFGYLHMQAARLKGVLLQSIYGNDSKFCFYSQEGESKEEVGTSLVFTFHAGVDPDPDFSNVNVGKLFLDREKNLVFASWPDPKLYEKSPPPLRKEILFHNVASCTMRFFSYKPPVEPGKVANQEEKGVWLTEWKKEYKAQPQLVEVLLTFAPENSEEASQDLLFSCLIPRAFPIIEY